MVSTADSCETDWPFDASLYATAKILRASLLPGYLTVLASSPAPALFDEKLHPATDKQTQADWSLLWCSNKPRSLPSDLLLWLTLSS